MKIKIFSVSLFLIFIIIFSAKNEAQKEATQSINQPITQPSIELTNVCDAKLSFVSAPNVKSQDVKLSDTVSMVLTQYLTSYNSRFGSKVATNVICQKLTGAKYTGSDEEWVKFIQQATSGMKNSGGENMRLELIGENVKQFKQKINNKEYKLFGDFNGLKQAIHNVAILDKSKNTVYIISVSGGLKAEKAIKEEFERITESFSLNNVI